MSQYSDLANKVAQLTQRLNDIVSSARKIFELPFQSMLKPGSKLQVSNPDNISEFITIQQILDAALSYRQNQLLSIGTITVAGNDLTIPAGATWVINNIDYSNPADIVINVPYAEDGFTRTDIIVADQFNNMYRVNGPETEGVSPAPNVPLNTVLITTINVTDATIGTTPPITGITTDDITNVSGVPGAYDSDALDYLNTNKENISNKAADFIIVNDVLYPTVQATKTYADALLVGVINLRGTWSASGNIFPTSGGSGTSGAIRKGDLWYVSAPGILAGKSVNVGDSFFALVNTPGQTDANWNVLESNIGYVPANDANVIHTTGDETKLGILNIIDKIQFGTAKTTYGVALAISKNITNSNLHIIDDYSVINASISPAAGYGIFDASTEMTGTAVYDHFNAYQSRLKYSGSGSINPFYGLNGFFVDNSHTGTGTINSHHAIYINDIGGTGTVTDNVGVYIRPITRGTRNFAIDSEGGASRFRGDIFNLNAKGFYSFSVGQLGEANTNFSAFFNNHDTLFYTGATGTETAGDFVFGKIQSGVQTGLMRITQDGKLGLNTNTPHATSDIITGIKSNSLNFDADSGLTIGSNIRQLSINSSDTGGVYDISLQARTNSNTSSTMRLNPLGGNVLIGNLSGSGTRTVVADASGNLSATSTPPDPRPYKVYTALLSQTGTSAPTATVLENTLGGSIVWSYVTIGVYDGTLSSAFVSSKTASFLNIGQVTGTTSAKWGIFPNSTSVMRIITNNNGTATDGILSTATVEIRVYN